jgi:hypothetical protein
MSTLTTALDTELKADSPLLFGAVEVLLPGYNLRLLDGALAALTVNGSTYTGRDATYGTLGGVEQLSDGLDNAAPGVRMTLLPPSNTATADLADPDAQGAQVAIWFGAINRSTGLVIADPALLFLGELDVPTLEVDRGSKALQYDVVSAFERFFDQDEGVRLNGPWHASVWAGETGLQYVVAIQQQLPWGSDAPRPILISDLGPATSPGAFAGAGGGGYYGVPGYGGGIALPSFRL